MKHLASAERFFTIGHIFSMVFGLAGLLLVLPNSAAIASLPPFGQVAFRWSMAGGAVAYMVLGTIAATLYACRFLGLYRWLAFALPAVLLSLGSELLGTSVGFPFGHYAYLDQSRLQNCRSRSLYHTALLVLFGFLRLHPRAGGAGSARRRELVAALGGDRFWRAPANGLGLRSRSGHEPNERAVLGLAATGRVLRDALSKYCRLAGNRGCVYDRCCSVVGGNAARSRSRQAQSPPRHLPQQFCVFRRDEPVRPPVDARHSGIDRWSDTGDRPVVDGRTRARVRAAC